MKKLGYVQSIGLALGLLGALAPAAAHVPYIEHWDVSDARPMTIRHAIEKSVGLYAYFENEWDVDVIRFFFSENDFDADVKLNNGICTPRGKKQDCPLIVTDENGVTGRLVYFGTVVPECSHYSDILPTVVLVGPRQENLPEPDAPLDLPFEIEEGQGVFVLTNETQGGSWYEPYTLKSYFDQSNAGLVLTEPGEYRLYFFEPNGRIGDYVAEIGKIEVWGLSEIAQASWYEMMLLHDGEIHSEECRAEL
ncbi:MAG: hypothetical protein MUC50_22615 [Myxococcota bacterium]|jgi:hypothetical protein|nr:hypothetical protein [Myxococcota bacterium]